MKKLVLTLDKDNDKRKKKRIELFSNISGQLDVLGTSSEAKIKDISYSGFGVIIPNDSKISTMETLEAKLSLTNQLFNGRIVNKTLLPNQQIKIGIALSMQLNREIDFNTHDSSWDQISDVDTIANIYNDLAFKGPECPLEIKQNFSKATLIPIEMNGSDTMVCEIFTVHQGSLEKGKAKCVFDLFQTCHAFDSNIEKLDKNKVQIKLSPVLARLLRRETVRVKKGIEYQTSVLLRSKSLDREISDFEIYDYSEHGLSLIDPNGDLSLPRNLKFEDVFIEIKGVGSIFGYAEVRSYEWNRELNAYIIGLIFRPYGEPHLTNWHNFILKARYPNLDFEYHGDDDHKKIWDLFVKSNYLHFKDDETFTDIIDLTKGTWKSLFGAGTQIAKKAMIRMDDKIVGHIQMDRIFDKAWCLHHLAVDPDLRITTAKNLLTITPDVLLTEGGEYVVSFTDNSDSWNKKSYYNFIEKYQFADHNALREFKTYEVGIDKNFSKLKFFPDYTISIASKYELRSILKFFQNRYTDLEYRALDFETDPYLEKINALLLRNNLFRGRQYLVAKKDNDIYGFSVVELASEGINILGVFNCSYIYVVGPRSESEAKEVEESLIKATLDFYKTKQIKYSLIFIEAPTQDYTAKDINLMCNANRWIAKKDVFPRFSSFTNLLYGHLELRREKIRKKIKVS